MKNQITIQLILTILVLTVIPMVGSYFLLQDTIERAVGLGFDEKISDLIDRNQSQLKELRSLKPSEEKRYHREFLNTQELKAIFGEGSMVKQALSQTLRTYFWLGLSVLLLVAIGVALILSRNIQRIFNLNLKELLQHREKVHYLEEISQWQTVAQKLAHEIKGPLAPIELSVGNLLRSYSKRTPTEFARDLEECSQIVTEEIRHLRELMQHFSEFSKLPEAKLVRCDLIPFLSSFVETHRRAWPQVELVLENHWPETNAWTQLDSGLMRQVLFNLATNATEANPNKPIQVKLLLQQDRQFAQIRVINTGSPISEEVREQLFDVYFSTKSNRDHMGLGLAIAKKTAIEHGGSLEYVPVSEGAEFRIEIPTLERNEDQ